MSKQIFLNYEFFAKLIFSNGDRFSWSNNEKITGSRGCRWKTMKIISVLRIWGRNGWTRSHRSFWMYFEWVIIVSLSTNFPREVQTLKNTLYLNNWKNKSNSKLIENEEISRNHTNIRMPEEYVPMKISCEFWMQSCVCYYLIICFVNHNILSC